MMLSSRGMSSPRAATSVTTRTLALLALNLAVAICLATCILAFQRAVLDRCGDV